MQYTRNTVTGSSTADVILLLVDARNGVVEQTRRHLAVASLLRVPHVVLAVNKIDLVDYSEEKFSEIATDFALLARSLNVPDTHCIPVSATEGDNVAVRSTRMPWYDGPTVLGYLETVDVTPLTTFAELRFPVQQVVRPQTAERAPWASGTPDLTADYRGYAGQLASGRVRVGDEVVVLPRGSHTTVVGIDTPDGAAGPGGGRSVGHPPAGQGHRRVPRRPDRLHRRPARPRTRDRRARSPGSPTASWRSAPGSWCSTARR